MVRWLVLSALLFGQLAFAVCASLVKGPMAFDVNKCGLLSPEKTFITTEDRYQFIANLSPEDRKKFYNSYRGLVVDGLVVKSLAIRSGLSPEKGALNGDHISVFIPPNTISCQQIAGKRLKVVMDEACCEGGGDPPCLLNTTYILTNIEVLGAAGSAKGNRKRMASESNPDYQKANYYLKLKNFQAASEMYLKLLKANQLDLRGHYFLAFAYRMLDQCHLANPVLDKIFSASERNDYWADDETIVRKANFLYARCLAKEGNADRSVIVLQSFLLDPAKFRPEIRLSLTHPDFGRIQTTKIYGQYKDLALKAVKR